MGVTQNRDDRTGLIGRWARVIRILLVCLVLSSAVCSASYAKCGPICPGAETNDAEHTAAKTNQTLQKMKDFAAKLGELTGITKVINALTPLFQSGLTKFGEKEEMQTAMRLAMQRAMMAVDRMKHDDAAKVAFMQADIEAQAKVAGANPPQDMKQSTLCTTITARQMVPVMEQFSDLVAHYVTIGFVRERDASVARSRDMRYGRLNQNDPPMGSRVNGDPETYWGAENVQLAPGLKASFPDASVSALTLGLGSTSLNQIVLMLPKMTPQEIKISENETVTASIPIAEEGNYQQQMWIAARDYCLNMAGLASMPGKIGEGAVPNDVTSAGTNGACRAARNTFFYACAHRLGDLTRPNCDEPTLKPFCEKSKLSCEAGLANGMVLPDSFENCEKGLNAYETKQVAIRLCATEARKAKALAASVGQGYLFTRLNQSCNALQDQWNKEQAAEKKSLMDAVQGLREVPGCWAGRRG